MDTIKPREMLDALSAFGGVPFMDVKLFAERTGMTVDAVNKSIQRGQIPVIRFSERRRLVNVVALVYFCMTGEFPSGMPNQSKVVAGSDSKTAGSSSAPVRPELTPPGTGAVNRNRNKRRSKRR